MNTELIEQMKKNRAPNYLLTTTEYECLQKAGVDNIQKASVDMECWADIAGCPWYGNGADSYRIKSDYQSEPETERCIVFGEVDYGRLVYTRDGDRTRELTEALNDPDYIRCEDKDGNPMPLKVQRLNTNERAKTPKCVLFAKEK